MYQSIKSQSWQHSQWMIDKNTIPFWPRPKVVGPFHPWPIHFLLGLRSVRWLYSNFPFLWVISVCDFRGWCFSKNYFTCCGHKIFTMLSLQKMRWKCYHYQKGLLNTTAVGSPSAPSEKVRKKAAARAAAFIGLRYLHSPMRSSFLIVDALMSEDSISMKCPKYENHNSWKKNSQYIEIT